MSAPKAARPSLRERLDGAECASRDQQFNLGHATALLTLLARESGEKCHSIGDRTVNMDMQARWLRVEYLASQIEAHVFDLTKGIDIVEHVIGDLRAEQ